MRERRSFTPEQAHGSGTARSVRHACQRFSNGTPVARNCRSLRVSTVSPREPPRSPRSARRTDGRPVMRHERAPRARYSLPRARCRVVERQDSPEAVDERAISPLVELAPSPVRCLAGPYLVVTRCEGVARVQGRAIDRRRIGEQVPIVSVQRGVHGQDHVTQGARRRRPGRSYQPPHALLHRACHPAPRSGATTRGQPRQDVGSSGTACRAPCWHRALA